MYLFVDTETSGLPRNHKAPLEDLENWPRLVQIAWILYNETGFLIDRKDYIIKPDGFKIPSDATAVHGISTEKAKKHGVNLSTVLNELNQYIDQASTVVAHNMSFDEMIIGAEYLRAGRPNPLSSKATLCTMKLTTNFVGIKGYYGNKWPTLGELHFRLFGHGFAEAHNAAADINATAKCFWEAKRLGVIVDNTRPNIGQNQIALRFNGIYQSEKTNGVWHYLRFYDDWTVLSTKSGDDPIHLLKWFKKPLDNETLAAIGTYELDENRIQFAPISIRGQLFYNGIVERNCLTLNIQSPPNEFERSKPFFFMQLEFQ